MANFFDRFDPQPAQPTQLPLLAGPPSQQPGVPVSDALPQVRPLNTLPMDQQKAVISTLRQKPDDPELRAKIDRDFGSGTSDKIAGPLKGTPGTSGNPYADMVAASSQPSGNPYTDMVNGVQVPAGANPFDQFDAPPSSAPAPSGGNYFDRFDPPSSGGSIRQMTPQEESTLADVAKSAGIGIVKGLNAVPGFGGDLQTGVHWLAGKIADTLGVPPAEGEGSWKPALPTSADVQRAEEQVTGPFHQPTTTAEKYAETVGEFLPGAIALPGAAAERALNAMRYGAIPGVASEAAGQATEGTAAEPYARVAGAVLGSLAGPGIAKIPGRVITPLPIPPERAALVQTLEKEGVPLTAGQATGNKPLQWAESTLSDMPFAGDKAAEIQRAQKEAFTSAALKRAGIDEKLATPDVLAAGKEALGGRFQEIAGRNALQMDKKFGQDLNNATSDYQNLVPESMRAPGVQGVADDLLSASITGEPIPGDAYQSIRSSLTKKAENLRFSDPPQAQAYRDVRNALDNAMDRSIMRTNPKDVGAWAKLRKQYANYKAIEKAAGSAGEAAAQGFISPAQLKGAISSGKKRGDYATGKGDLAELTRAGIGVMSPLPNSGTAPRAHIQHLLTGGGIGAAVGGLHGAIAGIAAPAVAGRVLMSKPAQSYLKNQIVTKFGNFPRTKAGYRALAAATAGKTALGHRHREPDTRL